MLCSVDRVIKRTNIPGISLTRVAATYIQETRSSTTGIT